jgi:dipeptidyl aminopeptidase/acylaminoacyl peptidase
VIERFMGRAPTGLAHDDYRRASPSNHISSDLPPLMLIYGAVDGQVEIEAADEFVAALGRASCHDVSYLRLGQVDQCPHSIVRVGWLVPAVNEFFQRTLRRRP